MRYLGQSSALLSILGFFVPIEVTSQKTCSNFGSLSTADANACICPPGFLSSTDCLQPQCGGTILESGSNVAPQSTGTSGLRNVTAGDCDCESGWNGPVCSVCSATQACTSIFPTTIDANSTTSVASVPISQNQDLICSNSPYIYASSQLLCNVVNPTLQSLFSGKSELGITRTVSTGNSPVGSNNRSAGFGDDGTAYAQLWYNGVEQFNCKAESCKQSAYSNSSDASTFTCASLSCFCIPNTEFCATLGTVINDLSGTLEIACEAPTNGSNLGSCTFSQTLLKQLFPPSGLGLVDCQYGECVSQGVVDIIQGNVDPAATAADKEDSLSGGVIAGLAVVGTIVLAILALIGWGLLSQKKARKAGAASLDDSAFGRKKGFGAGVEWSSVGYHLKRSRNRSLATLGRKSSSIEDKSILEGITGKLNPGGFCCVLGPSGAGKSTFVDILGGRRKAAGRVVGQVHFSGNDTSSGGAKVKHRVGFVDQEDVLNPTSTVREALLFAARLRLPESISDQAKQELVFQVMKDLGLVDVADVKIGDGLKRGISGGERRRVSIGVELVAAPDVLILDEPTSGLDSVSAARIVAILQSLARDVQYPTTIIASIHQPSSRLYQTFDTVLVLAQGKQLYFGPGGHAPAAYFESRGHVCPAGYNVADHLLEIASSPPGLIQSLVAGASTSPAEPQAIYRLKGVESRTAETPGLVEKGIALDNTVPTLNASSTNSGSSGLDLNDNSDREENIIIPVTSKISHKRATTFLTQLQVLSGREVRNLQRDWSLLFTHLAAACVLGVFAGGLYFQIDLSIAGFQNRVGSLFFLGSLIAFSTLSALYNLMSVRALFLRERAGSFYSPLAWLLSRVLFDLIPLRLIPTIIVTTIVYFMVGLNSDAARFFKCLLILVEFSLCLTFFNMLLATVLPNGGISILLSSLHNLYLMTYAGFFVNLSKIPPVLRWLRWFDVLGYALEATVVNEVGAGLEIVDSLAGVPVRISATLIMDTLFGFDIDNYYRDVLVLFAFIAGYGGLLVLAVWFLLKETR